MLRTDDGCGVYKYTAAVTSEQEADSLVFNHKFNISDETHESLVQILYDASIRCKWYGDPDSSPQLISEDFGFPDYNVHLPQGWTCVIPDFGITPTVGNATHGIYNGGVSALALMNSLGSLTTPFLIPLEVSFPGSDESYFIQFFQLDDIGQLTEGYLIQMAGDGQGA